MEKTVAIDRGFAAGLILAASGTWLIVNAVAFIQAWRAYEPCSGPPVPCPPLITRGPRPDFFPLAVAYLFSAGANSIIGLGLIWGWAEAPRGKWFEEKVENALGLVLILAGLWFLFPGGLALSSGDSYYFFFKPGLVDLALNPMVWIPVVNIGAGAVLIWGSARGLVGSKAGPSVQ